jgi:hypothetical protein
VRKFIEPPMVFVEEEAASRHSVFEGNGLNRNGAVGEDDGFPTRIDSVKNDFVADVLEVVIHLGTHQFFEVRVRVNMQRLCPSHHIERGNESDESEAMVTVKMRDKNRIETGSLEVHLPHRQLDTLATIDEKRLVAQVENLSGRRILKRGQGTTCS